MKAMVSKKGIELFGEKLSEVRISWVSISLSVYHRCRVASFCPSRKLSNFLLYLLFFFFSIITLGFSQFYPILSILLGFRNKNRVYVSQHPLLVLSCSSQVGKFLQRFFLLAINLEFDYTESTFFLLFFSQVCRKIREQYHSRSYAKNT